MVKNTVQLHFGCGKDRNHKTLDLNGQKMAEWNEYDLHRLTLKTDLITKITLGPKTVVQIYSDPYLYRLRKRLMNGSSTKGKEFEIGCIEDHGTWAGILRSFRVWDYDYYMSLYGTRYCDTNDECRDGELCLCKGGEMNKDWCPVSKKRCKPKAHFLHNAEREVNKDDLVNIGCMMNQIRKHQRGDEMKVLSFRDVTDIANQCSNTDMINPHSGQYSLNYYYKAHSDIPDLKHQFSTIEGFGPQITKRTKHNLIWLMIIAVIFYLLYNLR